MTKKSKKTNIHSVVRETMRDCALAYRDWTKPKRFDGTLKTYHHNISMGMKCLQAAIDLRKLSHGEKA